MNDPINGEADTDYLKLESQLCFPLYAATNLLQRLYRPLLQPLGLTYSQYLVLLLLWDRQTLTVGALKECLHLDSGTITPLLKRMEKAGFVERNRDPADERRVLISITSKSSSLRAQAAKIPLSLIENLEMEAAEGILLRDSAFGFVEKISQALSRQATVADADMSNLSD